jgi:hypothetical protein
MILIAGSSALAMQPMTRLSAIELNRLDQLVTAINTTSRA